MAKLTERRIMYVCTECADTMPECCGHYDPSDLAVMPDGRWLCENCFEEERWSLCKDDESFPPLMSEMQHPPIFEECGKFEDSNAVHLNMLRGAIAKPSIDQIAHIYPNIGAVLSAASALVEALALYGFPVSDAAEPALRDGGSREAKALHHAAKNFAAAIRALEAQEQGR